MRSDDATTTRTRLAEVLGKPVSDALWAALAAERYLPIYDDDDFAHLVREARRRLGTRRRSGSSTKADGEIVDPRLSVREQRRADVVRDYFAKHATENELVRRFRQDVLGGELLNTQQAIGFLESWANRIFRLDRFHRQHVSPMSHDAVLLERKERANETFQAAVIVNGHAWRFRHARVEDERAWNSTRTDGSWEFRIQTATGSSLGLFRANSVIGFLEHVARDLRSQGYPWVEQSEAWFVLTGNDLNTSPLDVRTRLIMGEATQRATISMQIEPWINHRTVADLYRRFQRQLLQRHNRPIEDRRLAVFRFVTEQRSEDGQLPTWRSMMQAWNDGTREWVYHDPRNFQRDASEAERMLLWPDYKYLPKMEETHG